MLLHEVHFGLEKNLGAENDVSLDECDFFDEFSLFNDPHAFHISSQLYKKRTRKRRRHANPSFLPAIRILRRDIRRKYSEMMTNVLNSCDAALHRCFLQEFAVPHVTDYYQEFPSELLAHFHYPRKVQGIEEQVEVFRRQCLSTPDITFRLSDVKICQRLDMPGSRIVASMLVKGTMLYTIISDQYILNANTPLTEEEQTMFAVENQLSKTALLKALDNPIDLSLKGTLTMYLDENHRFVSIVIDAAWL